MPSLSTVAGYIRAVHVAAGRRVTFYPVSAYSILLSRFCYGIGPRLHALFGLIDEPQEKWKNYLVDEDLRVILRRVNPLCHRELVNDKLAFYEHCNEHNLDTIPVLCAVDKNATEGHGNANIISSVDEWAVRLQGWRQPLFLKLIDGSWGEHAFVAEPVGDEWRYCEGEVGSTEELYKFALKRFEGKRGWIVQPKFSSHPVLESISSAGALATIRVVTCLVDGSPELFFACVRIPVGDNVTDNFSHGSSGNITAPVDPKTGEIGVCRGSLSKYWPEISNVDFHPDTGNRIQGTRIPFWSDVLDLLDRAQRSLPDLRTLGWDIAITNTGPVVVEANATYDVDVIQVSHQRGIGDILKPWFEINDVW